MGARGPGARPHVQEAVCVKQLGVTVVLQGEAALGVSSQAGDRSCSAQGPRVSTWGRRGIEVLGVLDREAERGLGEFARTLRTERKYKLNHKFRQTT